MIDHYFHDMCRVLCLLHQRLTEKGEVWAVVGDSRYAGIQVPVARILADYAPAFGYRVLTIEPFRSMRASAQQGGQYQLAESLLVLQKES
jgi:hypothetical protein